MNQQVEMDERVSQATANLVAALTIGNKRLGLADIESLIATARMTVHALDDRHYLFVRTPGERETFFGCGRPAGLADVMIEDGRPAYLFLLAREDCPNCREIFG